jgi:hypothetical protein
MRHLAWAGIAVATAIAVAASCVPDFEFRQQASSSGAAGDGGAAGAGGGTSTTSTGGAGGMGDGGMGGAGGDAGPTPTVYCGETSSAECNPGEICCYHTADPDCDKCALEQCVGEAGCAQNGYAVFFCDDAADCAPRQCCLTYFGDPPIAYQGSACQDSCSDVQYRLCRTVADCDPGQACVSIQYPNYARCL